MLFRNPAPKLTSDAVETSQVMAHQDPPSPTATPVILHYGLAVLSVAIGLGSALLLRKFDLRESLFLMAIAVTVWFGGMGPGLLAIVLSILSLDYFFLAPIYSISIDLSHLPYLILFTLFGLSISWLSASRRHAEQYLRQARNELQRKVAEQIDELRKQASLLNLTHDSIFVRNTNDAITYWNRGAEELYGWKAEEALGKVTHQLMQTEFPAPLEEIQAELLRTGRWEGELVHTKIDGTQVVVASRWALQRDDSGKPVGVLETNNDISERKRAEDALRQAEADLTHVSRVTTMGELTASLAHEVNQPIAAAVTDANTCLRWLTRDHPDVQEAREAALRMAKDATRAAEIITRIRLLFKKGTVQRELIDVNEVIREMIVLLRSELTRYSISVRTALPPDLPQVMGDRVQLQQVFMNLMLNGIDAMKDMNAGGELAITSQYGEDSQLLISVSDTGVGLPPKHVDQIFNAFFTTKLHGTGMGLSISRTIMESHGGRLWAADNTPRGASFYLSLPTNVEAHE
jgi:two-component system, LuxR family, sensor kinase FixL